MIPDEKDRANRWDLNTSIKDAITTELDRVIARHPIRGKRDAQRIAIRAIQRHVEGIKIRVRNIADRMISEEEVKFHEATGSIRTEYHRAIVVAREAHKTELELIEAVYREALVPFRERTDQEIQGIRDDLAKRMSEADAILHRSIKAIKTATPKPGEDPDHISVQVTP